MFRLTIEPELEPFLHRRIERINEADPHASPDERTKQFAEITDVAYGDSILVQDERGIILKIRKPKNRGVIQIIGKDGTTYTVSEIGMTSSVRHIVTAWAREIAQFSQEAMDLGLCVLADRELISIRKGGNGRWNWVAKPELIRRYDLRASRLQTQKGRRVKIRMDNVLERNADEHYALVRARKGKRAKRHRVTAAWLISQELGNRAIAYVDAKGHLAWKAVDTCTNNVIRFPGNTGGRKQSA
jgi:hypothetical protein